jgi:uncharacterized membrane protein
MTDRLDRDARDATRLLAIDVVRGIVMVLMTLDHASGSFNAGRLMGDSAATFDPTSTLEPLQFVTRWVTHLCAPTFLLLSGVSLALSIERRQREGVDASVIDREILIRGALLVALDALWMSWIWRLGIALHLGVLHAIGMAMIGMIALRRLRPAVVGGLGLVVLVGSEALIARLDPGMPLVAATLAGGQVGPVYFLYAFVPWTGYTMLGWALGMRLAGGRGMRASDWLVLAAIAAVAFAIVRGLNDYGNAELLRREGPAWTGWKAAAIEWLHVSKYPPSLAFTALELAILFALLAAVWRWSRPWKPLVLLGQTALFYYLLHVHLLKGAAHVVGLYRTEGLAVTYVAWAAATLLLIPPCRWYLGVKRRHPDSVLRFG